MNMVDTEQNFDVAVIGNVGIDTNVYLQNKMIDFDVEANFTENLDYIGQAGGYSARGFAKLGYQVAFIGYVGDDVSGKYILNELAGDGINIDAVFVDPAGTSRSINFMFPDGTRKNFYDGKSHMTLRPDIQLCKSILVKATLAHFHLPNWARFLLPIAKESGAIISCDLQDIVDPNDDYRQDFIHFADIIFFSSVNNVSSVSFIEAVLKKYPEKLIITGMGSAGCAVGTKDGIKFFKAIKMNRAIVDTNGAGDGLAVGFLAGYCLEHLDVQPSIQRGQITARYTCSLKADTANLIGTDELDSYTQTLP